MNINALAKKIDYFYKLAEGESFSPNLRVSIHGVLLSWLTTWVAGNDQQFSNIVEAEINTNKTSADELKLYKNIVFGVQLDLLVNSDMVHKNFNQSVAFKLYLGRINGITADGQQNEISAATKSNIINSINSLISGARKNAIDQQLKDHLVNMNLKSRIEQETMGKTGNMAPVTTIEGITIPISFAPNYIPNS
jgi:hypothetical protein